MKLKNTPSFLKNRKVQVAAIVTAVILLAGGYVLWSTTAWNTYETTYKTWRADTGGRVTAALALPVTSDKERADKYTALKASSEAIITAKDSLCRVNVFIAWQQFIEAFHNRETACQKVIDTAGAFDSLSKGAVGYLENEQALAGIMAAIPHDKSELAEGDWEAQATAWHDAVRKADELKVGANFTATKQSARETIGKIATAWQEVVTAHKAKDRGKYEAARAQLVLAYGSLGATSDVGTQQLKTLLEPLQPAYKAAFE